LVGPALNVLLNHFFQLRSQMDRYDHSLPQVLMPQPESLPFDFCTIVEYRSWKRSFCK
jgi:hypothetical protein